MRQTRPDDHIVATPRDSIAAALFKRADFMMAVVVSVSCDRAHRFSKVAGGEVRLIAGLGVEGDAHAGATVRHRSRVARDPTQPNLRQVHLIQSELFGELEQAGFAIGPADLGENILTRGLDLLALSEGAELRIGGSARVLITGLRNPCVQLDRFRPGLMKAVFRRDPNGGLVRKAGVMGIVAEGGTVRPGDAIHVLPPTGAHRPLLPV